jgi:hypothetical protein
MAAPIAAQDIAKLREELATKQEAAQGDATALFDLAKWAKEKGLVRESRAILKKVVELEPEHEEARGMLGFVKYEGEWMTKSKARIMQRKAFEAEQRAKGLVKVDGLWIPEAEEEEAKKGLFRHEGNIVSREEKKAFMAGQVRHPRTGEFIDGQQIEQAKSGLFPIGDGKWGNEQEANEYHTDLQHPWVVRFPHCTIVSTYSLQGIENISFHAESAITGVMTLFGNKDPMPGHRPVIIVASGIEQYNQLGNDIGAEGSAYSAFISEQEMDFPGLGLVRPIVCNWQDDTWGVYFLRHGAGLAYVYGICADAEIDPPVWFLRGVAGLAERYYDDSIKAWFGSQHEQAGGVNELGPWFDTYEISPNLEWTMLSYNIFQAALVLDYAMKGGDEEATKAVQAVTAAFNENGPAAEEALANFRTVMATKEDEVRDYLSKVTGNPPTPKKAPESKETGESKEPAESKGK